MRDKSEPDFTSLVNGIVLTDDKEQKLSDIQNEIQSLTVLCERMEHDIEQYSSIEKNLSEELRQIHTSVRTMGLIRDQIGQIKDERIRTVVDVRIKNTDNMLENYENRLKLYIEEGSNKCQQVVEDVAYRLKSLLLGRTNDMEPVYISAKTKHWIITSTVISYLVVLTILAIVVYARTGN